MTRINSVFKSLINHFDEYQRHHKGVGLPFAIFKKYQDDQAGRWAAIFIYYAFLALFPLLLVLTTGVKLLIRNNSQLRNQVIRGAITYFPVVGHDLQQDIHGISKTGLALIIGLALTLFGARGVADVLRTSLDHIWQI